MYTDVCGGAAGTGKRYRVDRDDDGLGKGTEFTSNGERERDR